LKCDRCIPEKPLCNIEIIEALLRNRKLINDYMGIAEKEGRTMEQLLGLGFMVHSLKSGTILRSFSPEEQQRLEIEEVDPTNVTQNQPRLSLTNPNCPFAIKFKQ
jgi:hypothetical protein